MKYFVKEITWLSPCETGWGNGYVCIPKSHQLYGKDYDQIHTLMPDLDVHGGLTFAARSEDCKSRDDGGNFWPEMPDECYADHWVVGFDCCHYGDNRFTCSEHYVRAEVERLSKQLEEYHS